MKTLVNLLITCILFLSVFSACLKHEENPYAYDKGTFPDSVLSLDGLNSEYDDYNLNIISGTGPVIFSSNRGSQGGQFDVVQGLISFVFDRTDGYFEMGTTMTNDPFLNALLIKSNSDQDDFGPYRFFSKIDGYEYMILSSPDTDGKLKFKYLRHLPQYGQNIPDILGPFPVNLLNSASNDAYFCFDLNQDSAYFCSDRNGNFDIFLLTKPAASTVLQWFDQPFSASVPVDSVNSSSADKCPQLLKNYMVFASDRPGGYGGFDLYYSIFRKGKWSSPVNMGPGINTAGNEYRPVLGIHPDFTNYFMMFSSDRPGGKGGYDLYFTGVDFK
jgi:hypothetical protein